MTPPAVAGLVMSGAARILVPVRTPRVADPPLLNRTLAVFAPSDNGENRTAAVQVAKLATMPAQVVDIT